MTHVWNQTIVVDAGLAKRLIQAQCDLIVNTIEIYGEGWDNIAFLVNQNLIFRFPRREQAIACMENEITLLPYLAHSLTFPFSCPKYIGKPTANYPYPFAGYVLIPGKMLMDFEPEQINTIKIAETLAHWLQQLHHVPVQEQHLKLIQGEQDWRLNVPNRIHLCMENIHQYANYFEAAGFNLKQLQQTIVGLERFHFDKINACYLHGDLYFKHIIADDDLSLTGLIDWGDIHLGSPGIDLAAAIMLFEDDVLAHFWKTYQINDERLFAIAAFRAFYHPILFLPYAFEQQDEKGIKWATIALKRGLAAIIQY